MNYLFASTNFGTETVLKKELLSLGAENINVINGGIYYEANELLLYKSLMWSRIASRIFLCIKKFKINSTEELYFNIYNINWTEIFCKNNTFLINFEGTNNFIRNSLFGALIIKDAIIDQFKNKYLTRLNINLTNPDIKIKSFLSSDNIIHIMLDLSGPSLHERGYRQLCNSTPIKENLGAALVLNSGWDKDIPMIDPMCGSGTLLIEAAMISSDRAPGLKRLKWGFQSWKKYNKTLWLNIVKEAEERFLIGIEKCFKDFLIGYDYNSITIEKAKINASNAGVSKIIQFFQKNLNNLRNFYDNKKNGILLTNPPYGKREHTESQLVALYIQLGFTSRKYFKNWILSVISSSKFLLNFLQMQSEQEYPLKNGALNCIQKNYKIFSKEFYITNDEYQNRLKKNVKKFQNWVNQEEIECFRFYNADLPNYNIAIDIYNKWLVIQEYKAPKIINCQKTHKRLCHAIYYAKEILSIDINNIILKIRQKNKNKTQYTKLFNSKSFIIVKEYYAKFLVNLIDYLDTGLFSDKRLIRKMLGKMSLGKDFLNLFSYTGTATVYAGLGKANTTTSVDMSNTYLQWSMRNMSINNLTSSNHYFIKSDCLSWIEKTNQTFDLIFINPPTFSNSKNMKKNFDLKRDYLAIIIKLKRILRYNGKIIFSSSTRNFNIDLNSLKQIKLYAKNITKQVQCKDFSNNISAYNSWLIKHL